MTPTDLAARVAALLDAGCPGHVRDLFEDLTGEVGRVAARGLVRDALVAFRVARVLRGDEVTATAGPLAQARGLSAELWAETRDEAAP